jgi:hypothetical protein
MQSIIKALNSKFKNRFSYTLQEADLGSLKVWQGQILDLSLDVANTPHHIYSGGPQNEDQWLSLRRILPTSQSQGGMRLQTDWQAIESNLVRPLRDGASLPDFSLEGPLDLYFTPPADLQLWLPHSVEAGIQKRIMLRAGAALTVRGARSVQLRRALDLPNISLSDFVQFALEDKDKHQAAGLMHLATGLREKATLQMNKTEGKTPALIGLEIEFADGSGGGGGGGGGGKGKKQANGQGTLFAAPDEHGALQRLRVKRIVGDGALEISVRKAGNSESAVSSGNGRMTVEASKALVQLARPGSPYVWPFRSASPETVTSYEHLLRELLSRQIFSASAKMKKESTAKADGAAVAPELALKLHRSSSTAAFLLKMDLAVIRKPIEESTAKINQKESKKARKEKENDAPSTPGQLLQLTQSKYHQGDHSDARPQREVYSAVVKIEGSAREGLRFSPVGPLKLVEQTLEKTVTFSREAALSQVAGELGMGVLSNASMLPVKDEL